MMTDSDLERIQKFIHKADRHTLELALYNVLKDWTYKKAISLCSASVVRKDIMKLESIKDEKLYEGLSNNDLKLVKESGHDEINKRISELKEELEKYRKVFENEKLTTDN